MKPVRRKTRDRYSLLYINKPRRLVVELQPGDVIEFRELGRRCRWQLPIEAAFRFALRRAAFAATVSKRARKV